MRNREDDFRIKTSDGRFHDDQLVANAHQAGLDREKFHDKYGHEDEEDRRAKLYGVPFSVALVFLIWWIRELGGGLYWTLLVIPPLACVGSVMYVNSLPPLSRKLIDWGLIAALVLAVVYVFRTF